MNCRHQHAQAECGLRHYQAWLDYLDDTCPEDRLSVWRYCNHRFDESSARFAAPCVRRIDGRAGWRVCQSC